MSEEIPTEVSPAELQTYLAGVSYPASKEVLVDTATQEGAPEAIMELLESFTEQEYASPAEVTKEYSRVKQEYEPEFGKGETTEDEE